MLTLLPIQSKFVECPAQEVLLSLPRAGGSTTALLSAVKKEMMMCNNGVHKRALIVTRWPHYFDMMVRFYTHYKVSRLNKTFELGNGNIIQFACIQHPSDVQRLMASEFHFIGIEGLERFSDYEFFNLKKRCIPRTNGLMRYTGSISAIRKIKKWIQCKDTRKRIINPQWGLKKHFMRKNLSGARVVIEKKILENPHLPPEYIRNIDSLYFRKPQSIDPRSTFRPSAV